MTQVTFGISASSFVANMCGKHNALNPAHEYPLAAKALKESFYVDDGLTGADDTQTAIRLQKELSELFAHGGFQLHKRNSNNPDVLNHLDPDSRVNQDSHSISDLRESTKTLGLE